MKKFWIYVLVVGFLCIFSASAFAQLEVTINPSKAQREVGGKVWVDIFISGVTEPLLSYGIKVNFNPSVLQVVAAEKNTDIWKFEDNGFTSTKPDVVIDNGAGEVMMIGGRLKPGVTGDNILLGHIVFEGTNLGVSSITVGLAKPDPYENFVDENEVLHDDEITFPTGLICIVEDACEGDINGDGYINNIDMLYLRRALPSSHGDSRYNAAADLNGDGYINNIDALILRRELPRVDCPNCP